MDPEKAARVVLFRVYATMICPFLAVAAGGLELIVGADDLALAAAAVVMAAFASVASLGRLLHVQIREQIVFGTVALTVAAGVIYGLAVLVIDSSISFTF
jgi:hypothetical protein